MVKCEDNWEEQINLDFDACHSNLAQADLSESCADHDTWCCYRWTETFFTTLKFRADPYLICVVVSIQSCPGQSDQDDQFVSSTLILHPQAAPWHIWDILPHSVLCNTSWPLFCKIMLLPPHPSHTPSQLLTVSVGLGFEGSPCSLPAGSQHNFTLR